MNKRSWTFLFHQADGPKVIGKVFIKQIGVRHCEIPLEPPGFTPGVPNDKPLRRIIIPHREDGVPCRATICISAWFAWSGKVQYSGLSNCIAHERLINREAKHKRKAVGEAPFHLSKAPGDTLIIKRL